MADSSPTTYVFHSFLSRLGFLKEFWNIPELGMNKAAQEKKI
jgi:hypothetical protein